MKTIFLLTIIFFGTMVTPAQTENPYSINFVAVSNICGAPSDVNVQVVNQGSSKVKIDLILLDENNTPFSVISSLSVNSFGYVTFLAVQPCMSYRVQPRVTKGEALTFTPAFTTIDVHDGNPFNLEFVATSLDN